MKIAILDLGTNTFNIFIAEVFSDNTFSKIYKSKISVKLGEGGINNNHIEKKPFERGINALIKHQRTIERFGVQKIIAYATSAIRSANNGNEFVRVAKEKTGIIIQIISGEREAELIYYGVRSAIARKDEPFLIVDIGGGSTEFILANKNEIIWKHSFFLGITRVLEKFKPSDPITKTELISIENHFKQNLTLLVDTIHSSSIQNTGGCSELIGSSGSFDSIAEMIGYRFHNKEVLKGKTEYDFNLHDFEKLYRILLKSTNKERLQMKGLIKMRVDMIVVSAIFINYILKEFGFKKMRGSKYSLKEGALLELIHS